MSPTGQWRISAAEIGPGHSAVFRLACGSREVSGFVVNHQGQFHAYVNRCAHAGTPLDTWPNEFWSHDRRHLICSTHGAVYDPATGVCVEGPCPGARLERLPVEQHGEAVVVSCPSSPSAP
jgi:nitrite reductase/ring-hydroxylating ferredoxin subunit